MGKDKEGIEHVEGAGGNGEGVDRNHSAEVIAKERFPVLERGATRMWYHVVATVRGARVIPSLSNSP
jgi:hypothetical protein